MKKLISILLLVTVVVVCAAALPVEAEAAEITSGTCGDNLTWTLDSVGTLTIFGTGSMSSYPPGMYTPWMDYTESVTSIVIKDGVTTVGYGAFSGFTNLSIVAIPASMTSVGAAAFANCSGLTQVFYCGTNEQWSAISFGASNTCLTDAQHTNHQWLDATIAEPKTCIYCGVTEGDPLRSGTCGDNLTWVLDGAGTLTISGTGVMQNNTGYTGVPWYKFREAIKTVIISDGVTNICDYAFCECISLTNVTIPNSVTSIGNSAFRRCTELTGIAIPDNVMSIGYYAFSNCTSITSVTIPNGVTCIQAGAFSNCTSLTSITIPNSITCINGNAFSNCTSLTSITIPNGVTFIGSSAFSGCTALAYHTYGNANYLGNTSNPYYALISPVATDISSCQLHPEVKVFVPNALSDCTSLTSVIIPNGITSIGNYAFYGCVSLTNINIPKSVTFIGSSAFQNCKNLTNVTIPNSVTSIGDSAFSGCKNLTSVTIPNSVTSIGDDAFSSTGLTSVRIPNSVTSIGSSAFYHCENLTSVTLSNSITSISDRMFYYCTSLTSVIIPDSVTEIEEYAFLYCTSLPSVIIPDSVTSIGYSAFEKCTNLTSVTIPDSLTYIGNDAFYGCSKLTGNLYGNGRYLGNSENPYVLLMGQHSSGDLIVPSSVKCIYPTYFYVNNVYITDLAAWCNISFGVGYHDHAEDLFWEESDCGYNDSHEFYGNPLYFAQNLYLNDELITHLSIPNAVTKINDGAFIGLQNLTSIRIPESVTSVGQAAFSGCTGLTSVTYCGTTEQWNQIEIGLNNTALDNVLCNSHQWTSITVTKHPTYTSMGEGVRSSCLYCGKERGDDIVSIPAKFYGTSVNLGNTLDMYFGFYTGLVDEGGKVVFVREFADGTTETTEAPITSFKKNNSVYDITYTGLAAKEMCDTIRVYVYNSEGTLVGEHSDSIRSYILRQLREKEYGQEFRTLCVDLLNYGAAAQKTFGYNLDDLANKDLTAEELAEGTQTTAEYTDQQTKSGEVDSFYGTAYILETKISMSMAVRASYFDEGCYALVSYTDHTGTEKSNIRLEGKKNNSVYEFVLNEIVVADGRCLLTIEFYKADGTKVVTVQDSMESYTARNAAVYPLAKEMLAFSDAAYKYLHRNDQ